MSLKYHFQHIKNKTLKNVVFFTFHGTQNETIIFKNQTITIKEQRFYPHIPGSSKKQPSHEAPHPTGVMSPRPSLQCCLLNFVFGGLQKNSHLGQSYMDTLIL